MKPIFYQNPKLLGLGRKFWKVDFGALGLFLADLSAPILSESLVLVCYYSTITFYKKLRLYIQIPNIYLGLGFEFGPNRTRELSVRNSWSKITLEKKEEKGCHEQIEVVFQFRPILCNIKRLIAVG